MKPFRSLIDRWRNAPLSLKLIGTISLFLALVTLGNGLYITLSERQVLSEQLDAQGESLARAASIFALEPLLIRDYPILETFTENMVQAKHNVDQVTVLRADGKTVATSRQSEASQHRHRSYVAQIKADPTDERSIGQVEIILSTYRSEQLVTERLWTLGGISLFTFLLLGLLIAWLIRNSVARPLQSLKENALALGRGDLETAIVLPSRDELGTLANTLEVMRNGLKNSYSAIEKQNQELKTLDRMKDEFLARISHELNTPLNSILGLSDAIGKGSYGEIDTALREPVTTINQSGRRLKSLAEQLLSFNQQEGEEQQSQLILLEPFLQGLLTHYKPQIESKQLRHRCRVEPDLQLQSDTELLGSICNQLLDNAVKFTDDGDIELVAESIGTAGVAISLTDTGIGIPEENQSRIYDRFEQGFGYENRRYEGAGIGLAMVKQRVEQINGRILLNSIPGTGSRFTLILPQTGAASVDDLAAEWLANHQESGWPSQQPTAEKPSRETAPPPVNKTAEQIRTPAEKPPHQEDGRATILVVDDDRANRMVANASLRKQYTILEAESGMQCLNQLETEPVDLVLLDLMMPDMSGFEVLEEMKTHPERRYPPVIVLSALMDSKTISHTLQLGAVDYLTKPFNREEILARVHSQILLAQRELHLEHMVQQRTKQLQESNLRLEETFQQLLQSEKMASIGQLAAGVAHEINNPVGFIHSNLSTLSEYLDAIGTLLGNYKDLGQAVSESDTQKVQLLLEQIDALRTEADIDFILEDIPGLVADTREGTERVKSIVQGMKAFSRADDGEMAEADINAGIEATLKVVWNELKYKAEVHKSLGALPKTFCNLNQLNQVFTNLLVNAAHAIGEHGEIDIRTQQVGDEIIIEIADTGSGIESKHIQSLFDPFFTTKPVGQGTGLGLYLSYEIIQKHRGSIDVQSEVGKGTRFTIRLPIVSAN
ncbi:hypothetical protein DJ030_05585 [bacterium endosymbiont of Escarpia laminata]|nr:MAG: hypothetical protein DJ030_05585 [bacterium endosymbiont of Escarpia laminata]